MSPNGRRRRLRTIPALAGAALLLAAGMILAFAGARLVVTPAGATATPGHSAVSGHSALPGSTLGDPEAVLLIG